MPERAYCGASFEDEAAYHEHLRATHAEDLGPIDRRLVSAAATGGLGRSRRLLLLGCVALVIGGVIAVVAIGGGDGGGTEGAAAEASRTPTDLWGVHYHGTITVEIDGQPVDFSRPAYQLQADAFHFENRDGRRWHVHARGVTLEWAMATVGLEVGPARVTFRGTTYDDADPGTRVVVEVDGSAVTPSEYVLEPGDRVRIVADTGG
jgi:sulfur carrier protein ThiS